MAGELLWCATPTGTLCCWSKESWTDDCQTAAAIPMSRSGIRADRLKLNQHGREYRSSAARVVDLTRGDSHHHNGRADQRCTAFHYQDQYRSMYITFCL